MKFFRNLFIFLAIILVVNGIDSFLDTIFFIDKATKGVGKVVDYEIEERYDSEEGEYYYVYYPIVSYKNIEKDLNFTFQSTTGNSYREAYEIGSDVPIFYLKVENSFHAEIDGFSELWFPTVSYFGGATIIGGLGIFFALKIVNTKKSPHLRKSKKLKQNIVI
ncbi:MAG: hypothetical protein CR982_09290 [Candidatus Cloacimonadota bacterium]|nr:MAG: hypothetical protein CR982_09290 [Candidatus Cloacimonadota bacterium]PIE77503.1 MAG: hypothetical protein CSA15_12580 [Candidatus Delongbacteria bacterium]